MKWINPREQLPVKDQLIWIIFNIHKEGDRGPYFGAECRIAKISVRKYGILCAEEITHKGQEGYPRYFGSWSPEDYYVDAEHYNIIYAWAPFDKSDLPTWDYLTEEESKQMITSGDEYKQQLGIDEQNKKIEEATKGQMSFIHLADEKPLRSGMYVVATKNCTALSMYDASLDHPWIVNGEPVIAWYPVPSHY